MMMPERIYVYKEDTGEYTELTGITEINIGTAPEPLNIPDMQNISDGMEFTVKLKLQPKAKIHLLGVTNNCIRMHGGKPIRTIQKRFL